MDDYEGSFWSVRLFASSGLAISNVLWGISVSGIQSLTASRRGKKICEFVDAEILYGSYSFRIDLAKSASKYAFKTRDLREGKRILSLRMSQRDDERIISPQTCKSIVYE